jgi:TatD DNase family protein
MDMEQFDQDRDIVIQTAQRVGVKKILTVALSIPGAHQTLKICHQYPTLFLAALGIHPHDAQKASGKTIEEMASLLTSQPFFVAVGEIGLDYYRNLSPREDQQQMFRTQLRLAKELTLPVLIHCRDAQADTLSIMKEEDVSLIGGIMHCFSGDEGFARECLKLNLLISFAGPLTYKKSATLREVVRETPLERILTETDCPYLAPLPHRGERNEPAYVAAVVHNIAEIKRIPPSEVASQIVMNFKQLFHKSVTSQ